MDVTAPEDVTDPVLVDVNGVGYYVNITDGKGKLVILDAAGGDYTVTARYPGDDKYDASENVTKSVKVSQVPSTVSVKVDNITYGDKAVIEVTVPSDATGTVTVEIDGKPYTANISAGKALIVVPDLEAGAYDVDVTYNGDDKYESSSNSTKLDVAKVKVDSDDIKVVDKGNGTVVVVVPENATGNITIKVGDKNYTAPIVNGTAVVTVDNSTPGTHDVEVIYSGDDNNEGTSTTSKLTVPKETAPISVDVDDIKVGDTAVITVTVPDDATGTVTIEIDGVKYTEDVNDGKAVFNIKDLPAGNKTIAVEYSGDDKYLANHTTDSIEVSKRQAHLEVEIKDVDAGDNVTVIVHLPEDATGQVLIDIDGVGYYVNVTNGTGIVQIPRIPSGSHEVNLTYTGDDKYGSSSTKTTFNVTKVESFVIPQAENIFAGEDEVITVVVPEDATGTVTIVIGGTAYEFDLSTGVLSVPDGDEVYTISVDKGTGKLIVTGLPQGDYTVSAKYNGDAKYLPSTNTTTFRVVKSNTTMDIIDSGNGTIKVVLPDDATGTVTVNVDGKNYTAPVINGVATFDISDATPGKHPMEVTYSGDRTHLPEKEVTTTIVPKYDTPISVEIPDIEVGDTATISVTVPKDATGDMTIEIDGVQYTAEIKDGKATFNVKDLTYGNKTVVVKYVGDKYYGENFTSTQFTVSKKDSNIKASAKDITVGKDATINVNVPSDATGRVLVKIDGIGYYADVINGKAKVIIPELPAGKYTAEVFYEGDDKYEASQLTTVKFTVSKSKAPVSASGDMVVIGEDASVVVKLPEDATGTVTITVDGKKYTAEVKSGQARFEIPGLSKGEYKVNVYYSGDKKYDSNSTVTYVVIDGNEGSNNCTQSYNASSKEGISLSVHATGNPIWILLLLLLTVVSTQIRRFRK